MDQPSSADDSGITLRIKFKSESVDHFIARYGADVSPGGIFIRTRDPLGVGTSLRFEFSLADGHSLLAGHGTVVWVREPDSTRAGVVPGMGVRFDKLTPESQNALGTILAGKTGKENSGAARLSAARPVIPAAPLEPETAEFQSRPTPASMKAADDGNGTADPWQSDKTEIAETPPSFSPDGPRTSEELSLSGAEPLDFGAARGTPPGQAATPVLPSRKPVAVTTVEAKAPLPALGSVIRDAAGNVSTPVRRNSPASGVGATPILTPPATGPTSPTPSLPSRSLSEALGVPSSPPAPAAARPPSGQVSPSGGGEDLSTDPFNRENAAIAAAAARPSGRGKMLVVIAISALATAGLALFGLKRLAMQDTPAPTPPPPPVVTAPAPPPPAPAPSPAPSAATPTPPPAATPTPPPAAAPAPPPPAPAPAPAAAATPAPKAPPAAPKVPKAPKPRKPPAETATAAEPAAAPAAEDPNGAVEEYWLRVRSTPAGAEVLIDGQVEGKTPFERRLFDPTRPYALTVRKAGFETHEQMLSASDEWVKKGNKRTLTVPVKLTKGKSGASEEPAPSDKPAEPAPVENPPATP
jgi:molecular chaperone DnaK